MADTSILPLLRLPSLLLENVLDNMPVVVQYNLSRTSKKARLVVKNFLAHRHGQFRLSMKCSNSFRLLLNDQIHKGLVLSRAVHPSDAYVISLIKHFAYVFDISQVSLEFDKKSHILINNIIRVIKKLRLKIKKFDVYSNGVHDRLLEIILNECRQVSDLYIECETTRDFTYEHRAGEPFQCDSLRITYGKWITQKHMVDLFMDCKKVILDKCGHVTYNELKTFLTRWIQGCKLEYIQFPNGGYVFSSMFADLLATNVNRVKVGGRIQNFRDGKCYLIRNINGKEAVVYREEKTLINPQAREDFILTTDFEL